MNAIEIRGFTKIYQQKRVIDQVSMTVKEGEIYGFIGPNGAGKSTTIRALLDFIKVDEGEGRIFGLDTVKDAREIRRLAAYVSSDVRFYPRMTTERILDDVLAFHQMKRADAEKERLIALFQIERKKRAEALSLGNKKKIALAAALLTQPKLLILDEPTNGLDPFMQHRLFEELERRNQESGLTVFLSSHDLAEIQSHAQQAAFIRGGKIVTVQDISKEKSLGKVVTISGQQLVKPFFTEAAFTLLKGENDSQRYLYQGDVKALLPLLNHEEISDFTIETPDLEDQFLALYEGGVPDDHL